MRYLLDRRRFIAEGLVEKYENMEEKPAPPSLMAEIRKLSADTPPIKNFDDFSKEIKNKRTTGMVKPKIDVSIIKTYEGFCDNNCDNNTPNQGGPNPRHVRQFVDEEEEEE